MADLLNKATVLVLSKDGMGSGFFISDRDIVTNHHVAATSTTSRSAHGARRFCPRQSRRRRRRVASAERGTSPCSKSSQRPGSEALRIARGPGTARAGDGCRFSRRSSLDDALTPGGPMPEPNLTQGMVTSHQMQEPEGMGTIIHTATIGHGNSGGPLVDEGGCAVGVNSWLSLDAEGTDLSDLRPGARFLGIAQVPRREGRQIRRVRLAVSRGAPPPARTPRPHACAGARRPAPAHP